MLFFADLLDESQGELTDEVFLAMLQGMEQQGLAPSTMDGYRAAYRFWHRDGFGTI